MSDEDGGVVCRICGKKLKSVNNTHLKKHGITVVEYLEMFNLTMSDILSAGTKALYVANNRSKELYKDKAWSDILGEGRAEQQKKLFRKIAAERYAKGILKPKISRPHKTLMNLLSLYNISYECEYHIGDYAADVAILDKKIIIEVNGIYFHNRAGLSWEELDETQQNLPSRVIKYLF